MNLLDISARMSASRTHGDHSDAIDAYHQRAEGNATRGRKGKTQKAWPLNAPKPMKPSTGPAAPKHVDSAVRAMREAGMKVEDKAMSSRNGGGWAAPTGTTSTRLYALRGPIQFRPYNTSKRGYANALHIRVDAGNIVIRPMAKTKVAPAHWRVELHIGNDITTLHDGFNSYGNPANRDAAIGNAYKFLIR